MSRMQRKLVVVASESVFEVVPPDTDGYERARLWKGLYEDLGVLDRDPEWRGTVGEFVGDHPAPGGDPDPGEPATDTDGGGSDTAAATGEDSTGVDRGTGVEVYSLGGVRSTEGEGEGDEDGG